MEINDPTDAMIVASCLRAVAELWDFLGGIHIPDEVSAEMVNKRMDRMHEECTAIVADQWSPEWIDGLDETRLAHVCEAVKAWSTVDHHAELLAVKLRAAVALSN